MDFSTAIQEGTLKYYPKTKNLVFGLEVTNVGSKINEKFHKFLRHLFQN